MITVHNAEEERLAREHIIEVAKSWMLTPFIDGQGLKKCGVDCAYFLARVAEESGATARIELPAYSPQVYLHRKGDTTYLDLMKQYAREIAECEVKPADMVLYKVAASYTHGGIIISWPDSIIHPIRPHGVICSSANEGFVKFRDKKFFSVFGRR